MKIQEALVKAVNFHKEGKLAEAENLYRAIIATVPTQSDANHNLGLLLMNAGKLKEAVIFLQNAANINPGVPQYLVSLKAVKDAISASTSTASSISPIFESEAATADSSSEASKFLDAGNVFYLSKKFEEAVQSYKKAIELKPDYVEAYSNLGSALYYLGKLPEAESVFLKALELKPDYAECYSNLGSVYNDFERFEEAEKNLKKAIELKPDFCASYNNIGITYRNLKRLQEAESSYKKALELKPDYFEAYNNLGNTLYELGRLEEAENNFRKAIELNPSYAEAYNNLGGILSDKGRLEEAEINFRKAIELNPSYAEAHNNLGGVFNDTGRLEEAQAYYSKALELKPDYAECYRNLSTLKKFTHGDPQIERLKSLSKTVKKIEDKIQVCFALAKTLEDVGEYDESFNLYLEGNALRKKELGYSIETDRKLFSVIKSSFGGTSLTDEIRSKLPPLNLNEISPMPILIVGMPRSGTSLAEQILASHSGVFGAGELETLGVLAANLYFNVPPPAQDVYRACGAITAEYLKEIKKQPEYADNDVNGNDNKFGVPPKYGFVTDKMPLNFRFIGFLAHIMPNLKIINMTRDRTAVAWSVFSRYFPAKGLGFSNDLSDIAEYYKLYEDLMAFWENLFPGRIYNLNYELLTENFGEETRKLIDYCGLEWEDACLEFEKNKRAVRTASAAQVRKKIYKGSSQAWRRFEKNLKDFILFS